MFLSPSTPPTDQYPPSPTAGRALPAADERLLGFLLLLWSGVWPLAKQWLPAAGRAPPTPHTVQLGFNLASGDTVLYVDHNQ